MNRKKELRKAIGLRLKEIRKEFSLTQEVIAKILGTGRPNYTRIEMANKRCQAKMSKMSSPYL